MNDNVVHNSTRIFSGEGEHTEEEETGRGKEEEGREDSLWPQLESLPGALELRRLGVNLISQVKADADATELQGDEAACAKVLAPVKKKKKKKKRKKKKKKKKKKKRRKRKDSVQKNFLRKIRKTI